MILEVLEAEMAEEAVGWSDRQHCFGGVCPDAQTASHTWDMALSSASSLSLSLSLSLFSSKHVTIINPKPAKESTSDGLNMEFMLLVGLSHCQNIRT